MRKILVAILVILCSIAAIVMIEVWAQGNYRAMTNETVGNTVVRFDDIWITIKPNNEVTWRKIQ